MSSVKLIRLLGGCGSGGESQYDHAGQQNEICEEETQETHSSSSKQGLQWPHKRHNALKRKKSFKLMSYLCYPICKNRTSGLYLGRAMSE